MPSHIDVARDSTQGCCHYWKFSCFTQWPAPALQSVTVSAVLLLILLIEAYQWLGDAARHFARGRGQNTLFPAACKDLDLGLIATNDPQRLLPLQALIQVLKAQCNPLSQVLLCINLIFIWSNRQTSQTVQKYKHLLQQELINTKQDVSQTRVSALSAPAEGAGYIILAPGKAQPDLWENAESAGRIMGLWQGNHNIAKRCRTYSTIRNY